jgi:hypothetical protein
MEWKELIGHWVAKQKRKNVFKLPLKYSYEKTANQPINRTQKDAPVI